MKYTASDFLKTHIQQSKQRRIFHVKPPADYNLQLCFVKHYITWNKQHLYELILVGIVPRKNMHYIF